MFLHALLAQLVEHLHGKEGVSGSSPEEGLKNLQISTFCCLFRRDAGGDRGGGQPGAVLQGFSRLWRANGLAEGTLREHLIRIDRLGDP